MNGEVRAPRCWAVIPAAGSGERMGAGQPKQYLKLAGATVLEHAVRPFLGHPRIEGVVVVLARDDAEWEKLECASHSAIVSAVGGNARADSVLNGLEALSARAQEEDWVLVHDAARPCFTRTDLEGMISQLQNDEIGGLLALPLGDTLKRSGPADGSAAEITAVVVETIDRRALWRAQTPQMFRYGILRGALAAAKAADLIVTDEAAAIEAAGLKPRLIEGPPTNIKITRPQDLLLAEAILDNNSRTVQRKSETTMTQKIGSGYDIHVFAPGDHVMLGGVRIPHTHGVRAHSDGDVIVHALCDALLGAAGLGDIGQHFPDTDSRWRGSASSVFLHHVVELLALRSYRIVNVDITLLAERPRIGPHRDVIRKTLADLLKISTEAVNIKATTAEGLGAIGRGEGLAAQAVVALVGQD